MLRGFCVWTLDVFSGCTPDTHRAGGSSVLVWRLTACVSSDGWDGSHSERGRGRAEVWGVGETCVPHQGLSHSPGLQRAGERNLDPRHRTAALDSRHPQHRSGLTFDLTPLPHWSPLWLLLCASFSADYFLLRQYWIKYNYIYHWLFTTLCLWKRMTL